MTANTSSMLLEPLRFYAAFRGRTTRARFWMIAPILWVTQVIAFVLVPPVAGLVSLILFPPSLGLCIRRLHDTGRSGWWLLPPPLLSLPFGLLLAMTQIMLGDEIGHRILIGLGLLGLLMIAWTVLLIVLLARPGTDEPNRFGPVPHAGSTTASSPTVPPPSG